MFDVVRERKKSNFVILCNRCYTEITITQIDACKQQTLFDTFFCSIFVTYAYLHELRQFTLEINLGSQHNDFQFFFPIDHNNY